MKVILLAAALFTTAASAQMYTKLEAINATNGQTLNVKDTHFKAYNGVEGSPYNSMEFQPVKIEGYSKKLPDVRYNKFEDEMEFLDGKELKYVNRMPEVAISFPNSGKTYGVFEYPGKSENTRGYLEIIKTFGNGDQLLKRDRVILVDYQNDRSNPYLKEGKPYFMADKPVYFLKHEGKITAIPNKKTAAADILKKIYPQAASTITVNKLETDKDYGDLIGNFAK